MTDTPTTNAWRAAHRRMDRVLILFFIIDVFGVFIGLIYHDAWFTIVWLIAAVSAGMIAASERGSYFVSTMTEDDEFFNEKELIEAYIFARKLADASNLLAATTLSVGFVIGNPWWSNFLVALSAWFAGLFGLPLPMPPERIERATPRRPAGDFTASGDDLATPTGFAL